MYATALAQMKGGTGKTTVALNTAGALANRGHKVVVVDLDAQGNATEGLGKPEASEADGPNLRNALLGENVSFADIATKARNDGKGHLED